MSTTTRTSFEILAIIPGQGAREVEVSEGTTVAQLATELGVEDASRISALDGMSNAIGPSDIVTAETEVVNFVYKLAGA